MGLIKAHAQCNHAHVQTRDQHYWMMCASGTCWVHALLGKALISRMQYIFLQKHVNGVCRRRTSGCTP